MKGIRRYGFILSILLWSACEQKELCYDHDEHALKYQIQLGASYRLDWHDAHDDAYDWATNWPSHYLDYESLRPNIPYGLRVVTYPIAGGYQIHNLPAKGGKVSLNEGLHDLLLYNNDTEQIVFSDLNSVSAMRATTRTRIRSTYSNQCDKKENTVNALDMLYAMYISDHEAQRVINSVAIPVTLQPLVFTYKVRYEFAEGAEYVALARGALSGMAESVFLSTKRTSSESATILYDCEKTDFGVRALVKSFGVPNYSAEHDESRTDHAHMLNLEVKLTNGKLISSDFDVTDQVAAQPHGGVIVVKDIVISKQDSDGGGSVDSGFDVDVNGWGEHEDIPIPLL